MAKEPTDMNNTTISPAATARAADLVAERLHVDHGVTKRLGRWTSASQFDVRVRSGVLVLDLRSPEVTGDLEVRLDLRRSTVKLLLAEGDQVDHWGLGWSGRGRVKDDQRPAEPGARRVRLSGHAENSEVRVHRGGMAALSAMFSRAYVQDLRQAARTAANPTVDDPTRAAR
jgi:hypothetical protein